MWERRAWGLQKRTKIFLRDVSQLLWIDLLESCNEFIYLHEDCVKWFEIFEKDHFTMMRSISEFIQEMETETRE